MEKLLCFTVLLAITSSTLGLRSECGLPKDLGPCRFTEPCKPTLFSWNDTFIIVSWEGLFQGCHESQINQMYIKSEGKEVHYNIKVALSKQRTYLERKFCDNSKIALRIDFNEDHVDFPTDETFQQRVLHTHFNDCTNIIANKSNEAIIGGIAGGKLPSLSLLIIKAMASKVLYVWVLSCLTSPGVILLILIVLLSIWLVKLMKRRKFQRTPAKVDINDMYGTYDITGEQSDYSTVQDTNDYYG